MATAEEITFAFEAGEHWSGDSRGLKALVKEAKRLKFLPAGTLEWFKKGIRHGRGEIEMPSELSPVEPEPKLSPREQQIKAIKDAIVRKGVFNTGAAYGPEGQIIYWAIMDDDDVLFNDVSRGIDGRVGEILDFEDLPDSHIENAIKHEYLHSRVSYDPRAGWLGRKTHRV